MNLSRPFIERPIATVLLMTLVVLAGALAYSLLPVAALPEVDLPTLQVVTRYPGANPETMSATVSAPLERRLGQMPGLKDMHATSSEGINTITLQFSLETSLDVAGQEVQQAINAAARLLPAGLPAPPTYSKVNPGDAPILTLAASSDVLPLTEVADQADTRLAQNISRIGGVGQVALKGGQRKAIVIEANSQALAGGGHSLETVRTAVAAANQNLPKGKLDRGGQSYGIGGNDQLGTPADYRRLVLGFSDGRPLLLSSLARVAHGPESAREAAWSDSRPVIELEVHRQPGANVIEVADRVKALLPSLQAALPAAMRLEVVADRTESIRTSVRDVQRELAAAVALVILVIFLFLRNLPATVIPALAVPVTLVGTFAAVYALGFSLNNLTLMALTIAIGFVVDDAIVVLENIVRHQEGGASPLQAALDGARQIGFTIVSLSLALVAVMIPLLFMRGVVGRLFREFALTLSVAVLVSALVSLVFTPMLCARLLRHAPADGPAGPRPGWLARLQQGYERLLARSLRHCGAMVLLLAATIAASAAVLSALPKGLFPSEDTGMLVGLTQAEPGLSFEAMAERQQRLAERLRQDPAVEQVSSFVGVDPDNASLNQGRLLVRLKPAGQRVDAQDVLARLRQAPLQEPGLRLFIRSLQDLALDPQGGVADFRLSVQASTPAMLAQAHGQVLAALREEPVFGGVFSRTFQPGDALWLDFNRETAARLGVSQQQVSDALYDAFGERQISTVFSPLNQYRVVLKAAATFQSFDAALDAVFVRTPAGRSVPLSSLATMRLRPAPLVIARQNQFPAADLSFNLAPGRSVDAALARLEAALQRQPLPTGAEVTAEGTARLYQESLQDGAWLAAAAVAVVYILMGVLYESLVHPLTILSTLPAASLGALLALRAFGLQFDVIALIGIVLLVGIVMKNAIMMIDFAIELERGQGLGAAEAIAAAAAQRFRPILMTTVASLVGALPLALGTGSGAELRHPMGVAIVGGLAVSQLLTLFSTPALYLVLHRAAAWAAQRWQPRSATAISDAR